MIDIGYLKHYLQLLEVFTIREIKSRYKGSFLGPFWIILYPLLTTLIFSFIFGSFVKIKTEGIPYYIFVLSGLIVWNFFQQGVSLAKDALIWNRELITKASFPQDTLPLSYILSKIPDYLISTIILFIFYLKNNYQPGFSFAFIIIILIPLFLFTSGIALISALANAVFRDFGKLIDFLFMFSFYVTPIIYPESLIPNRFKIILYLNPIALFISVIRGMIFKGHLRLDLFFISLSLSLLVFVIGIMLFRTFSKKIADLI